MALHGKERQRGGKGEIIPLLSPEGKGTDMKKTKLSAALAYHQPEEKERGVSGWEKGLSSEGEFGGVSHPQGRLDGSL